MELKDELKTLLGSTVVLYTKVHGFHWNIECADFPQYHKFLGKLYTQIHETVDIIAEYIRVLDCYSPGCLTRFLELSIIKEQHQIPRAELMIAELLEDVTKISDLALHIFETAAQENQQGISNYMAELQDMYGKQAWMLRSTLKKQRA